MPYSDRETQLAAQRAHYQANKRIYKERTAKQRAKRQALVDSFKEGKECADCGGSFIKQVMHVHHPDRDGYVEGCVSKMIRDMRPLASIQATLDRCVLLCANCHIAHHVQNGTLGETQKAPTEVEA